MNPNETEVAKLAQNVRRTLTLLPGYWQRVEQRAAAFGMTEDEFIAHTCLAVIQSEPQDGEETAELQIPIPAPMLERLQHETEGSGRSVEELAGERLATVFGK